MHVAILAHRTSVLNLEWVVL